MPFHVHGSVMSESLVCVAVFGGGEYDVHHVKPEWPAFSLILSAARSLPSQGLKRSQLAFKHEAQTIWQLYLLSCRHTANTHEPICLYNCIFANTATHISWTHMPAHTDTNVGAHTYTDAGTHPGGPMAAGALRCAPGLDHQPAVSWTAQDLS